MRSIIVNKEGLICAEPSPDVMVSLLTNAQANGVGKQGDIGSGEFSSKFLQQASGDQLFERSQGIQALRDGMYRLCEAHLNQAIPQETYVEQMTDLVATLNFIVPIELCSKLNRELAKTMQMRRGALTEKMGKNENADVKSTTREPNMAPMADEERVTDISALTGILGLCIQTSFEFGRNIAVNSGLRGKARLEAQMAMRFSRFKIAHGLKEKGFSCAEMLLVSDGEIDCGALGVRDETPLVSEVATPLPAPAP
ncbi:hypothetical protein [Mesorhizobium sp. M0643]|uniref:hypothetical protein n=1 Tax=Mesorhizobium sp. M0643 TaxID=2956978 RepID=UPI003335A05F